MAETSFGSARFDVRDVVKVPGFPACAAKQDHAGKTTPSRTRIKRSGGRRCHRPPPPNYLSFFSFTLSRSQPYQPSRPSPVLHETGNTAMSLLSAVAKCVARSRSKST